MDARQWMPASLQLVVGRALAQQPGLRDVGFLDQQWRWRSPTSAQAPVGAAFPI